jgi:hypothetical protein
MVMRIGAVGVGALLALFVGTAVAEGPVPHPIPVDNPDAACVHCHEAPHPAKGEQTWDDCAACHNEAHWAPSTFTVEQHAELPFPLEGKHTGTDCGTCHVEARLHGLPNACAGCHIDRHRGLLGQTCEDCHSVQQFKPVQDFTHARTGFAIEGKHTGVACDACHGGASGQKLREGKGKGCDTCHTASHGDFGGTCATCHPADASVSFAATRGTHVFDHRVTGWPLERRHRVQSCASCHPAAGPKPDTRCESCHVSTHKGQLGGQCQDCHKPDRWSLVRFDHDLTGVTLRGSHQVATCVSCHQNERWIGISTACWDCHADEAAQAPRSVDAHTFGRVDCQDCHNLWRWSFQ